MKKGYRYKLEQCKKCRRLVYANVYIRHVKSGCRYGLKRVTAIKLAVDVTTCPAK